MSQSEGCSERGVAKWGASLCPAIVPSPAFLPQLSFLAVFLQSSIHAQSMGASPRPVLVLTSRALSCPCAQEGDVGAEQPDYSSWSSSCLLPPVSVPHISAQPTPPASALGHLSPFCKANRSPGKGSSSCSASRGFRHLLLAHTHTYTGCLYLTNNYLTKYANSIITVICLAVISV